MAEIASDLGHFIEQLRGLSPNVLLVLTVSPVPLAATATTQHVLCASTYSKSILRGAAQQVSEAHSRVVYFPAYEIITGPQARGDFFEADRRRVSAAGIGAVMSAFLGYCEINNSVVETNPSLQTGKNEATLVSEAIADSACEEVMVE